MPISPRSLLCTALLVLGACSASPPAPVEVPVTPAPSDSAPAPATAKPEQPAPKPAAAAVARSTCMFCGSEANNACTRPDLTEAEIGGLTCGAFRAGAFRGKARAACDPRCCPSGARGGPDTDADGIFDAEDKCPNDPEDRDGFEDADGCPDPDNDRDGVPDHQDHCCFLVGVDGKGKPTLDGCPH